MIVGRFLFIVRYSAMVWRVIEPLMLVFSVALIVLIACYSAMVWQLVGTSFCKPLPMR